MQIVRSRNPTEDLPLELFQRCFFSISYFSTTDKVLFPWNVNLFNNGAILRKSVLANTANSRPFRCYHWSRDQETISKIFRDEASLRDAFTDNDRYLGKERVITLEARCDRWDAGHGNHTMLVIEPSNRVARAHHCESASYKHTDLWPGQQYPSTEMLITNATFCITANAKARILYNASPLLRIFGSFGLEWWSYVMLIRSSQKDTKRKED